MKTILIPTDFSPNAWNAMQFAASMFQEEPCKHILLNTYQVPPSSVEAISVVYVEPMGQASEVGLKEQLEQFQALEHHANTVFDTVSGLGDLTRNVRNAVKELSADYIVMGTQGASGIGEVLMGSHTASVIKHTECPVICVPENAHFKPFKKVVLATDFQSIRDEAILDPLQQLARQYDAEVCILNVRSSENEPVPIEEATEGFALHGYFNETPHKFSTTNADKVEHGIQDFAHNNQSDLIALIKRNHSFWERLFNRSTTKKMAFHSDIPLLVLPESNKS